MSLRDQNQALFEEASVPKALCGYGYSNHYQSAYYPLSIIR